MDWSIFTRWVFTTNTLLYILTAVVTFICYWMMWSQKKEQGIRLLAYAMLFITTWSVSGALEQAAVDINNKLIWVVSGNLSAGCFLTLLALFVMSYFHYKIVKHRPFHIFLWGMVGLFFISQLTNPIHHLVWTGFVLGPEGSNTYYYLHGPVYYIAIVYSVLLFIHILAVLVASGVRYAGRNRVRAIWMIICLSIPLIATTIYYRLYPSRTGIDVMPIGFSICGLLICLVVFDDLQILLLERTRRLEVTVQDLNQEIERRSQLETALRNSQGILAQRLSDQSQKLVGLYDLLLIGNQVLEIESLQATSLEKIAGILGADAACLFQAGQGQLQLEAGFGLNEPTRAGLRSITTDWPAGSGDVRADIDFSQAADLPVEFGASGMQASLAKTISAQSPAAGLLCVFWKTPRSFSVEEIVLFGAVADGLGVILENTRLRLEIASAAATEERNRLARDLHDSVTQSLHSLVYSAETARQVAETRPDRLNRSLNLLESSARQALKEMRLLLYELRIASPQEGGLAEALQTRLDAVERKSYKNVRFEMDEKTDWPVSWEKELYSIAIEALNNSLKYALASELTVHLLGRDRQFEMHIIDNGRGFDPQSIHPGGMGLMSMSERAARLGGRLEIAASANQGTRISFYADGAVEEGEEE